MGAIPPPALPGSGSAGRGLGALLSARAYRAPRASMWNRVYLAGQRASIPCMGSGHVRQADDARNAPYGSTGCFMPHPPPREAPRPQRGAPDKSSGPCARGAAEGPCDFSSRVMKKPLARKRDSNMWWLGQRPNHHIFGFLSGTKAFSSRSRCLAGVPMQGAPPLRCGVRREGRLCAGGGSKGHQDGLPQALCRLRRSHIDPKPIMTHVRG